MMFLNIASPHTIYFRTVDQKKTPISQINGITNIGKAMMNGAAAAATATDGMDGTGASASTDNRTTGEVTSTQLFAQSNGQIVELCNDRVAIKSVWEDFFEKNSTT